MLCFIFQSYVIYKIFRDFSLSYLVYEITFPRLLLEKNKNIVQVCEPRVWGIQQGLAHLTQFFGPTCENWAPLVEKTK